MDPKPFLKWVGGKRQLIPFIKPHVPDKFNRYYEPFMGGAALFFELRPEKTTLVDANLRLTRTYRGVRDSVEAVISLLKGYIYEEEFYAKMRKEDIDNRTDAAVAAWFIYLNKTCFNGLYRVNRKNQFNVPIGNYKNPTICDEDNLRLCSLALQNVDIVHGSYQLIADAVEPGDFVYLDPPYVPLNTTADFTSYTADGFTARDQLRLRDLALHLKSIGVHILLSNSDTELVRELYGNGFSLQAVPARRAVNCNAGKRGAVSELLIY